MDKGCYTRELDGGKCSPYQSILLTLWWAITTMTTVGYGDTIPVSNAGRLVGGLAMLGGIIMLALPTTVFGAQFAEEMLPTIHKRLHTYLGPSGRATNFNRGE